MTRRNPYLFVVGAPRSGTTLLERILNAHPDQTVLPEADFIPRAPGVAIGSDPEVNAEIVQWVKDRRRTTARDAVNGRLRSLELSEEEIDAAAESATRWSDFVTALYDQVAARTNTPLVGQKDPVYTHSIPLLHALFPEAQFINLVRDGRDVALSMFKWALDKHPARTTLWQERPIAYCGLQWGTMVRRALNESLKLPDRSVMTLRYEDLVANPRETARSLCAFLGLRDAVDEMLAFHEGRQRAEDGLSIKDSWAPLTRGVRDWRNDLPDEDIALFEAIAGDSLVRHGYPLTRPLTDEYAEQAEACHKWWGEGRPDRPVLAGAAASSNAA